MDTHKFCGEVSAPETVIPALAGGAACGQHVTFGMSESEEVCRGITGGLTPTAKPPAWCRVHGNTRGTGRPFGS